MWFNVWLLDLSHIACFVCWYTLLLLLLVSSNENSNNCAVITTSQTSLRNNTNANNYGSNNIGTWRSLLSQQLCLAPAPQVDRVNFHSSTLKKKNVFFVLKLIWGIIISVQDIISLFTFSSGILSASEIITTKCTKTTNAIIWVQENSLISSQLSFMIQEHASRLYRNRNQCETLVIFTFLNHTMARSENLDPSWNISSPLGSKTSRLDVYSTRIPLNIKRVRGPTDPLEQHQVNREFSFYHSSFN